MTSGETISATGGQSRLAQNPHNHHAVQKGYLQPESYAKHSHGEVAASGPPRVGHHFAQVPVHANGRSNPLLGDGRLDSDNRQGIPDPLRARLEALSGFDLSDVRVHRHSAKPAQVNAFAYAQGNDIYLAPDQDRHLPHEGWHAVQQKQGRVQQKHITEANAFINADPHLESEARRMGARALDPVPTPRSLMLKPALYSTSQPLIQREIRTGGGANHVNEPYYKTGAGKAIGSKRSIAALIADPVRRVFDSTTELENFANGKTDYIGDVVTGTAGTFWYRLPATKLTVLGEEHHNPKGNVEDVILGVQTSRFKYEPFGELQSIKALNIPFTETQARLTQISTSGRRVSGLVDRAKFSPDLENITIKILTNALAVRNEFIAADPKNMDASTSKQWRGRAKTTEYSYGERLALYLSMGVRMAIDIAKQTFNPPKPGELPLVGAARNLKTFYQANQAVLDAFMQAKDKDDLIGIYELTQPNGFKNLTVIKQFTEVLFAYATSYIQQLGAETGNKKLESEGKSLAAKPGAKLEDFSPVREEIMWENIQDANKKGYLIVGMGDAHHTSLASRLDAAKIPHEEVTSSLDRQKKAVDAAWKP